MDDRPRRVVVRTSEPRLLAADLLQAGVVVGVRIEGDDGLVLDTEDARGARPRDRPARTRAWGEHSRGGGRRRGSRGRLPLPGGAMSSTPVTVPVATDTGSRSSSFVALYRLLLRLQVTPTAGRRDPRARIAGRAARRSLAQRRRAAARDDRGRARLRPRDRPAARDGLARDLERRRPRRGSPARLPLAEARAALAAAGGGDPRDGDDRRAARRGAARRRRDRRRRLAADRRDPARVRSRRRRLRRRLRRGRALAAARALVAKSSSGSQAKPCLSMSRFASAGVEGPVASSPPIDSPSSSPNAAM